MMKRQIASKMGGRKQHALTCPHCHGYETSKEGSHEHFIAKRDKKKLPFTYNRMPPTIKKDPKYAKLSMSQFLRKYPEWNPRKWDKEQF